MYRFNDRAFSGLMARMNGHIFLVVGRTPPEIEGMSHAVNILVNGVVEEWSEVALFQYIGAINETR
jgi:hypothetical protein